jgi:hypothetical protein
MSFEIAEADQYIWGSNGFRILRVVAARGQRDNYPQFVFTGRFENPQSL